MAIRQRRAPGEPQKPAHYHEHYIWPPGNDVIDGVMGPRKGRMGRWKGKIHVWKDVDGSLVYVGSFDDHLQARRAL